MIYVERRIILVDRLIQCDCHYTVEGPKGDRFSYNTCTATHISVLMFPKPLEVERLAVDEELCISDLDSPNPYRLPIGISHLTQCGHTDLKCVHMRPCCPVTHGPWPPQGGCGHYHVAVSAGSG